MAGSSTPRVAIVTPPFDDWAKAKLAGASKNEIRLRLIKRLVEIIIDLITFKH